jgi:hypothetical protein
MDLDTHRQADTNDLKQARLRLQCPFEFSQAHTTTQPPAGPGKNLPGAGHLRPTSYSLFTTIVTILDRAAIQVEIIEVSEVDVAFGRGRTDWL